MLVAGLFIGSAGGAIAWADTESTGSPAQSQGAEAPSSDPGAASAPVNKVATPLRDALQATVQRALVTLRKLQQQQQSTSPKQAETQSAKTQPAAANTAGEQQGSDPTTVDPSPAVPESNALASASTEVATSIEVATNSAPLATVPLSPPATVVGPVSPPATVVGPVSPPATVVGPVSPLVTMVGPLANALGTVANVALTIPGVLASLPTSPTPITDVITLIQEMLTSVTNVVVALVQLPSNLYSLLSLPAVTATSIVGGGVNPDAVAPVLAARASQSLEGPPIFVAGGMALPANIAPLEALGDIATTGLSNKLPASGISSLAQDVIVRSGLGSFLEHTVNALFVPASLSVLAAVALPGIGGLLLICALGMRIGYRQARALFEVRRAGIACFAGPGPLGVVRSGSLIALRPRALGVRPHRRALRVVRSETSREVSLRDRAA